MPNVEPRNGVNTSPRRQLPSRVSTTSETIRRATARISAIACSATASWLLSGVIVTAMPRRVAAATSMQS